ncbi:MAG: hypothetical protein N838_16950 [Thiohalocapsa sp. PB-PSB1]|nr:MAG: hypothetical protein N838_16950 [Thiohalocapsa sp. PB-PSB1]
MFAYRASHAEDVAKIGGAIFIRWCSYCDKLKQAMVHRSGEIGGERKTAGLAISSYQACEAWFVNRYFSLIEKSDFVLIDIDT